MRILRCSVSIQTQIFALFLIFTAASGTALGEPRDPVAEFLTPEVVSVLRRLPTLILNPAPKGAPWMRFEIASATAVHTTTNDLQYQRPISISGFLLGAQGGQYHVLDVLGDELWIDSAMVTLSSRTFAEDAKPLVDAAHQDFDAEYPFFDDVPGHVEDVFNFRHLGTPEWLLSAWSFQAGDRATAAAILFSRLKNETKPFDFDRESRYAIGFHEDLRMLRSFVVRDYAGAIKIGRYLSGRQFAGFGYQAQAMELVAQLRRRGDDFNALRLPSWSEWVALSGRMSRAEQIRYLADRLRLLRCSQQGRDGPGGFMYFTDPQFADVTERVSSATIRVEDGTVINPFVVLRRMKLTVPEIGILAPYVSDGDFLLTYDDLDFELERTLTRVSGLAIQIINDAAHQKVVAPDGGFDPARRQEDVQRLLKWCADHRSATPEQLILDTLRNSKDWGEFFSALRDAAKLHLSSAVPIILSRTTGATHDIGYPQDGGMERAWETRISIMQIVQELTKFDSPELLPASRQWLVTEPDDARYWAAVILLRHGQPDDVAAAIGALSKKDAPFLTSEGIDELLRIHSKESLALADSAIQRMDYNKPWFSRDEVLLRLFAAGRPAALEYIHHVLDNDLKDDHGYGSDEKTGKSVDYYSCGADHLVEMFYAEAVPPRNFPSGAPSAERIAARAAARRWMDSQFALITAGKPSDLRAPRRNRWYFTPFVDDD